MNEDRDKFLTEQMGEFWHERLTGYDCSCGGKIYWNQCNNIGFSTWEGFGKLWEWAQKQEWFENFRVFNHYHDDEDNYLESRHDVAEWLIDPDRFADTVYKYLKEVGK